MVTFRSVQCYPGLTYIFRPPDIVCRRTFILPVFLSSSSSFFFFFLLFFRRLISEIAEWNSTKTGHMLGSECNLKTHVRNLEYPIPLQMGSLHKNHFFRPLHNLTATLTAFILGRKRDINNRARALATRRRLLRRLKTT